MKVYFPCANQSNHSKKKGSHAKANSLSTYTPIILFHFTVVSVAILSYRKENILAVTKTNAVEVCDLLSVLEELL